MAAIARRHKRAAMTAERGFLMYAWRLIVVAVLALAVPAAAQQPSRSSSTTAEPGDSVTHHRFPVAGNQVEFTVTAGTLPINDTKGERQASIFYFAYTRDNAARESRPITFAFNGGPGASSVFLHLAALGPKTIAWPSDGSLPKPPVQLVDNRDSWLDLTDLVFIDPVGTGYSRPAASADDAGKRFWGVHEDLESLAAFINLYLNRSGRMTSPKYLVGESYGGFRAARLPRLLDEERGIAISGSFIISPVLEFSLQNGDEFNPLPDALRLPSYAAVMMERTKAVEPAMLANVERFTLGPYLSALIASPHDPTVMKPIVAEVARLTGLSEATVAEHDGRVPPGLFTKETRRADKLLLSRYDGSVSGLDPYPESGRTSYDPLFDGLRTIMSTAIAEYAAQTLEIRTELPYRTSNGEVARQWNWRSGLGRGEGYVGAADALREELAANPRLKIAIAHGMTDLVTPYLTSRYVIDHLPPTLTRDRVTLNLYAGGHMMYLRADSRARLHADAAKFYPAAPL
jgi:carboxypeptidase C (cathepsin A)